MELRLRVPESGHTGFYSSQWHIDQSKHDNYLRTFNNHPLVPQRHRDVECPHKPAHTCAQRHFFQYSHPRPLRAPQDVYTTAWRRQLPARTNPPRRWHETTAGGIRKLVPQPALHSALLEGSKGAVSSFPTFSHKIVGYWLLGSAASVFGIVVFGGLTRLTESG